MSNLQHIIKSYSESLQVGELVSYIGQQQTQRIQLEGLIGSQGPIVFAAAIKSLPQKVHLFVVKDKESAAYLQNDLENILSDVPVLLFPDSFKRPAYFDTLNQTQVLQRTEVIFKLSTEKYPKLVIVSYPEALFEKVVSREVISANQLIVNKGEKWDADLAIMVLVDAGFERTDFVYEPGQFSVRGGIIDLFSYGNDYPYRIELFDDEVESIRTFNPLTQLSLQQVNHLSIVPNLNTRFKQEQKVSLFEILSADTPIWIDSMDGLIAKLQYCFERAVEFGKKISALDNTEVREIFKDRAFLYPKDVNEAVREHSLVFMERQEGAMEATAHLRWQSKLQPSFNKNFDLLIKQLHDNKVNRYETYIFSENEKQIARLHAIFKDMNASTEWLPVPTSIREGYVDDQLQLACYTDHQIFQRHHQYRIRSGYGKEQALNARFIGELQIGDFVTHIDYGIGKYTGLERIEIGGKAQEAVRLVYKNNDILHVSIQSLHKIAKYIGKDGTQPQLSKIGSDTWKQMKIRTKKQIKDIAAGLIKLYAMRRTAKGHAFPPDGYLQNELEASFLFEDTPDQFSATQDVKADMEKEYPMDRLICGDVGFGKTEVAVRAAFKAVTDGKQVAILVPTTILALQHNKTFGDRLAEFSVKVEYINRFKTAKEKKEIFELTKQGKIDILIGTHAILNKDLVFKDLGLLVVDEEQKFGVAAKEKLRSLRYNVDTLTLTATPIPRTLQFSLMAARDLSVMRTPPPNRQPIHTEICVPEDNLIRDAIHFEIDRGGQVFYVHNRVSDLLDVAAKLKKLCPLGNFAVAHGQMESDKLEKVLLEFIAGHYDVLVCTNIIETGLDIPNANTIFINRADNFGLSDLHQLRGRVGRSNTKAYCYLLAPPLSTLPNDTKKRLLTIEQFSDLGSGFQVAMRDLDIRGAGNLLGGEQSGFISDIGYETYQKILDEAIQELKETDFKVLFKDEIAKKGSYVRDVNIETDVEMLIPESFVSNTQERLSLYTELDALENEESIAKYTSMLQDRFGKIPHQLSALFEGLRLRWLCKSIGFERLILKGNKLRCYFITNPQSSYYESAHFKKIMLFLQKHGRQMGISVKQTNRDFIFVQDDVRSIKQAKVTLQQVMDFLEKT